MPASLQTPALSNSIWSNSRSLFSRLDGIRRASSSLHCFRTKQLDDSAESANGSGSRVHAGADGGELKRRGGGVERLDGDSHFGDGHEGERVRSCSCSGGAEWHGDAGHLLREEHRLGGSGGEHGDGDVQCGSRISRHSDSGIQRFGHGESA